MTIVLGNQTKWFVCLAHVVMDSWLRKPLARVYMCFLFTASGSSEKLLLNPVPHFSATHAVPRLFRSSPTRFGMQTLDFVGVDLHNFDTQTERTDFGTRFVESDLNGWHQPAQFRLHSGNRENINEFEKGRMFTIRFRNNLIEGSRLWH